jgi:hypothetical protein
MTLDKVLHIDEVETPSDGKLRPANVSVIVTLGEDDIADFKVLAISIFDYDDSDFTECYEDEGDNCLSYILDTGHLDYIQSVVEPWYNDCLFDYGSIAKYEVQGYDRL